MSLSNELISQFAKLTANKKDTNSETTVYGEVVVDSYGNKYVRIDGSEELTPVESTVNCYPGERVTVMIKNHTATITGNITSPAARVEDVEDVATQISEFDIIISHRIQTEDINAVNAIIDNLKATIADIDGLTVINAQIETLLAKYASFEKVSVEDIDALNADIENLRALFGEFTDLSAEQINAVNANIDQLKAYNANLTYLSAVKAEIEDLTADKLSVKDADIKYANIDFSNIGEAAMEYFYAQSGLIKDVTIGDSVITGELVGVTIRGDLIQGNTIVADKLVIRGEDGIFYKLNTSLVTDGVELTEDEQNEYNSLDGKVILANSITATKISVDDLVAFDATIGGFNITDGSIYSGVKSSADNTTRGIYLDKNSQMYVGDSDNFIRYRKDQNGKYKLEIAADSIKFSTSGKTIEDTINEMQSSVDSSVKEIVLEYAISDSAVIPPTTDEWSTVMPELADDEYIWQRIVHILFDDTRVDGEPVCIANAGGSDGRGIVDIHPEYYLSSSRTELKHGSWSTEMPEYKTLRFLVNRDSEWIKTDEIIESDLITTSNGSNEVYIGTLTDGTEVMYCFMDVSGEKQCRKVTWSSGNRTFRPTSTVYDPTTISSYTTQTGDIVRMGYMLVGEVYEQRYFCDCGTYLWTRYTVEYSNPSEIYHTTPVRDSALDHVEHRVALAETSITENKNEIALRAKKEEVYTKDESYSRTETDSAISVKANEISSSVMETHVSKTEFGDQTVTIGTQIQQLSDKLTGLITDGINQSLMVWDAESMTYKFSTPAIEEAVKDISASLEGLNNNLGSVESTVDTLETMVNALGVTNEYIRIGKYSGDDSEEIDINSLEEYTRTVGYVMSSVNGGSSDIELPYWNYTTVGGAFKYVLIPVANMKITELTITANNSRPAHIVGLRSIPETIVDYSNADLSTHEEWDDVIEIMRSTSATFTNIPSDIKYLFIGTLWQGFDVTPASVVLTARVTEPCIELGESDSEFKLVITNTKMRFMDGSSVAAYVTNKSLYVEKAVVTDEFRQGGFVWKIRSNGNLGLIWKGE